MALPPKYCEFKTHCMHVLLNNKGEKNASEPLSRWAKCWPKLEPDFLVEIGKGTKIMKEFVLYPLQILHRFLFFTFKITFSRHGMSKK